MAGDEELKGYITTPMSTDPQTFTNPNTSYVEGTGANIHRTTIDFSRFGADRARVVIMATGSEANAGKGVEIYDVTNSVQLCEVIWSGSSQENALAGSWTSIDHLKSDTVLAVRAKGSTATEDITLYKTELQIQTRGLRIGRSG